MGEQAGAYFVLGVIALIIVTATLKIYIDHVLPRQLARRPVKRSTLAAATHYGEWDERDASVDVGFRASRATEVEAEVAAEATAEKREPAFVMTEKALQLRLDEATARAYDKGATELYAFLAGRGYLVPGKATAIKADFFKVSAGRQLQALNAAIAAVPVPPEAPEPAAAKPVSGNPRPAGAAYVGELAEQP
jgi:hypothetical protein